MAILTVITALTIMDGVVSLVILDGVIHITMAHIGDTILTIAIGDTLTMEMGMDMVVAMQVRIDLTEVYLLADQSIEIISILE